MKINLEEIQWMDNSTKSSALFKLSNMFEHVGYPDDQIDDQDWLGNDYLNVAFVYFFANV